MRFEFCRRSGRSNLSTRSMGGANSWIIPLSFDRSQTSAIAQGSAGHPTLLPVVEATVRPPRSRSSGRPPVGRPLAQSLPTLTRSSTSTSSRVERRLQCNAGVYGNLKSACSHLTEYPIPLKNSNPASTRGRKLFWQRDKADRRQLRSFLSTRATGPVVFGVQGALLGGLTETSVLLPMVTIRDPRGGSQVVTASAHI